SNMTASDSSFSREDVEIISRKSSHEGFLKVEIVQLRHRLFAGGWSADLQRELILKDRAIGVLLFDPWRDELVLVRQFRVGMVDEEQDPWLLELVAGMVGEGESDEAVAMREAIEEADCKPDRLISICDYYNSPGCSNEKIAVYCGRIDSQDAGGLGGLAEENEDIEIVVMSFDDAIAELNSGVINNAMTVIALQWLQLNKESVVDSWCGTES
ncbi:MAG TPA: NUDIX domain-containing protein, partial [Gammaproteobacteria bacterium]|nr:NUDIX domain-containing protein [Gammaproteobacteria bacterium]